VVSSFQPQVPTSFTRPAPGWPPGCQSDTTAPDGSRSTAVRPAPGTSNGSASTVAPSSRALAVASSRSSTETEEAQPVPWSAVCSWMPATSLPCSRHIV
jgi:hypothetical protein